MQLAQSSTDGDEFFQQKARHERRARAIIWAENSRARLCLKKAFRKIRVVIPAQKIKEIYIFKSCQRDPKAISSKV